MSTLNLLKTQPASFSLPSADRQEPDVDNRETAKVDPDGVPGYLTSIVSSSLAWLESDEHREEVWTAASVRLSERSGRSAMPSMTRSFRVGDGEDDGPVIDLFEPSLTEDNLGLKTWTSSVLLARRLPLLRRRFIPRTVWSQRVLELGSGTGLVGIAAAALWEVDVVLTDLPEIVPNLRRNVEANAALVQDTGRTLHVRPLDWADVGDTPKVESEQFAVVLAADPIYSSDHPRLLVSAVARWMQRTVHARFIVELPVRNGYAVERRDLRDRLAHAGMTLVEEGTETGYDDWLDAEGKPVEVECWWSAWKWSDVYLTSEKQNQTVH